MERLCLPLEVKTPTALRSQARRHQIHGDVCSTVQRQCTCVFVCVSVCVCLRVCVCTYV